MSREALRRKENSRCAEGVLVCGEKRAMWRGLSLWGVSRWMIVKCRGVGEVRVCL